MEVPLLPGHGGTHEELLKATWRNWFIGAREALDKLALECDQVFVGGLSMGASLAVLLAEQDPRVSGIMLLSTTLRYDGRDCPRTQVFLPLADLFPFLGKWFYWTEKPPYGLKDRAIAAHDHQSRGSSQARRKYTFWLVPYLCHIFAANGSSGPVK